MAPVAELTPPPGARVVEGGFLIPGLFDMHVHLDDAGEEALAMLVLEGVTSVRDLGGGLDLLDERIRRIEKGELVGPRVARAGFVIENQAWVDMVLSLGTMSEREAAAFRRTRIGIGSEDDVLEAVARVSESGADLLKFRTTPAPAVFRALMNEARPAGLRVAGHEPTTVDLVETATLGLGSLEHLPVRALQGGTTEEAWQRIFAAMVEHDVHATPTFRAMASRARTTEELEAAIAAAREDPRWRFLAPLLSGGWEQQVRERRVETPMDWRDIVARGEALMRRMHAAGVRFLAGTDLGVPLVYPGSSLHEELVALVESAGLRA